MEVASRFLKLFQGRPDAYGGDEGRANYGPVTVELVQGHLDGSHEPIGIYPIRFVAQHGNEEASDEFKMKIMRVRWGCCDIDTGDWNEAHRLATALQAMGLVPWVERSRSKGWHVWVFVAQSVAAFEMRRCLKVAYSAIGLPAKEANPKSELLRPNQLGNYVRLPYPNGLNDFTGRQCMMDRWDESQDGDGLGLKEFLDIGDEMVYSDRDKIIHWSTRWREPKKLAIVSNVKEDQDVEALVATLPKGVRTLYETGPKVKEGALVADTSSGLVGLARMVAVKGYKIEETYALVAAADRRWGKYHERVNPEMYYEDIVRRAYT